jgi:malate synthase
MSDTVAVLPLDLPPGVEVTGSPVPGWERVLTREALSFLTDLQRRYGRARESLLAERAGRQEALDLGAKLTFPPETSEIRLSDWQVADTPRDLLDRRVEITGPAEPKMTINALNSGARMFMADIEDALSPTWANVIEAQTTLQDAVRGTLAYDSPEGKSYRLGPSPAVLLVRPRGWHLTESHLHVDGAPMSASLFDAGLYLFHNAAERVRRGDTPAFYLPKLQSRLEAALWNDVFVHAQAHVGIPYGTIRATVLIETIHAAFQMDEILYHLRDHAAGLNAGRWDYLFSIIKTFRNDPSLTLPDRAQLTMTTPFMRAYTELLVRTCHRRGAHAIGGMAAFIPSRRDADVNATAMTRVREDKEREAGDGFDGTWVAHPDLVPLAKEVFDARLGARHDQRDRLREDVHVEPSDLLDFRVPGGRITEAGVRSNVAVALRYLESWLRGTGAAAIFNLMEDAATAEISRSQLWLWRKRGATLDDGRVVDTALLRTIRDEELAGIRSSGEGAIATRLDDAAALLDDLVLGDAYPEFLTLGAYPLLDRG